MLCERLLARRCEVLGKFLLGSGTGGHAETMSTYWGLVSIGGDNNPSRITRNPRQGRSSRWIRPSTPRSPAAPSS